MNKRTHIYIPYVISSSPDPLNILYSGDWVTTNHLWSPLIDRRNDGSIVPMLAKSWKKSINGLNWFFEIRDNSKWSDGTPMTIEQIVTSLNYSRKGTSHTDLSESIKSIKAINTNTIQISLNQVVPQFLYGLTYSDWSIIHPETVTNTDGRLRVNKFNKVSGPYKMKEIGSGKVLKSISLERNVSSPIKVNKKLMTGEIKYYRTCEELLKNQSSILSFRMYRDEFSIQCRKKLLNNGFKFFEEEPSWIIKADFTKNAMSSLPSSIRRGIIKYLSERLKGEYQSIGNIRATGLRASYLYGSLPENDFDSLIKEIPSVSKDLLQKYSISIVSMDIWAKWPSYKWLVKNLKDIGLKVKENIYSMEGFFTNFSNGTIHKESHLIFFPLGVGDIDPDGSWRIASRFLYPNTIKKKKLKQAYSLTDKNKREELYKNFARDLIRNGDYIPLVMNSDIVGLHESFDFKDGTAIRHGTSLFDVK